jgi:serine/threonine protein kinase
MAYNIYVSKSYIVMEFVHGYDLDTLIFPDEEFKLQLNEEEKGSISCQIAKGLSYLHGQKVPFLHQDIKPPNTCFK